MFDEEPPALTFSDFRRHWCDNSLAEQKISIDRQSPTLLRDVFKLYKKGLNIRAIPDVHFMGEDGSDASWPTSVYSREYFYLSMARLAPGDDNLHLFEGEKDHLMPIHCIESYDSLLFYYAGLLISHSALHEGYPIVGLLVCYSYVLVCYSYVLVCYSYVLVCYSYVLVCYSYVLVCYSYVFVCYSYVTRMYSCGVLVTILFYSSLYTGKLFK